MKPSLQRLFEFHELMNEFAAIERIVHVKRHGKNIKESDAEHSYNLAMMAWFIVEHFPELDKDKVIRLALVHDLVEIYAGDTFAFAEQALLDSKVAREAAAQEELAKQWQDFPSLHEAITEYEERRSPEARFVYALDKVIPNIAIYLNEGHTWHAHKITVERLHQEKVAKVALSPEVKPYWDALHTLLLASPEYISSA